MTVFRARRLQTRAVWVETVCQIANLAGNLVPEFPPFGCSADHFHKCSCSDLVTGLAYTLDEDCISPEPALTIGTGYNRMIKCRVEFERDYFLFKRMKFIRRIG